jgi:hypothetical protein
VTFFEALAMVFLAVFFAAFLALPGPRPLAGEAAFLLALPTRFEAVFLPFGADLAAFRVVLAAFLPAGLAVFLVAAVAFLAGAADLAALGSTAPIAVRIRLISRVTCSMVIIPSTVRSFRRSE